jgi:pimeloyl-ACP methyl ester carboxylesterase
MIGTAPHQGDVGLDEITLLERTVPRFTLDSVPGAGHFLYEEHPQSVVLAVHRAAAAAAAAGHAHGAGAP